MTKVQLIERIQGINRSARAEFLAEFSEAELQQYLNNLEEVWSSFKEQFVESTSDFESESPRVEEREAVLT